MKPYYEDDFVTLYHGDALAVLPSLAGPFDAILTDPPYGVEKASWDGDVWSLLEGVALESARLLSDDGVCFWFCSVNHLPRTITATSALPYRSQFIWYAPNKMGPSALGFSKYTPALVLSKNKSVHKGMTDARAVPIAEVGTEHPTPKPLPLMRYLVDQTTEPGDLILDPFGGSGTTLRAAKDCGRRAVGVEINERYCEITAHRLAQEVFDFEEAA